MVTFAALLLLFFFSGFSALVYQVVWQRLLGLFTGAEVVSVTLITSAYMLGMGIGSLAGGAVSDRLKSRSALIFVFAVAELIIAIFGATSKSFFYDFLYLTVPHLGNSKVLAFITLFCSLLLPTFLMGITLPFLARAFITSLDKAVDRIALLYGVNTLGAACGSVLAATILIRSVGYEKTLYIGASISLLCALGAAALGYLQRRNTGDSIVHKEESSPELKLDNEIPSALSNSPILYSFKTWLAISACSGFIALGLEIVWFRLLKVMLKANSMTYGWLLFIYLLGLALGTFLGSRISRKSQNSVTYFCLCQCLVCIYAVLSVDLLVRELGSAAYAQPLFEFFGRYNPIDFGTEQVPMQQLVNLYVVLPAVLIIPPTVLMGMSFCFLQRSIQNDVRLIGKRLGWLQGANIAGSTLGSLFVGLVSLHYLGTTGTMLVFLMFGCIFLFFYLTQVWTPAGSGLKLSRAVMCGVASFCAWSLLSSGFPSSNRIWMKLHGHSDDGTFIVKEDRSGVAALRSVAGGMDNMFVYINGQGHSELPYGLYHSQIGILPLFVHPKPEDIAVIGLGSGDTLYASGAHTATKTITCFEIVKPAFDCLLEWHKAHPYAPVESLINDQRIRIVFADGRKGLQREGKKYDIIQQDPLRAFDAGAGMLYSSEYFKSLQLYLKPGGYVVIWSPTARTRDTFIKAFPYTADFGGTIIGSCQPITVDDTKVKQSFNLNRIAGYLEKTGVKEALLDESLGWYSGHATAREVNTSDLNHDLNPKDEFMVPQLK